MQKMSTDTTYTLIEDVLLTEVENEVVLLNLASGAYFGLNHVGAQLIKDLQANLSIAQSIQQITELYQMDQSVVDADIRALVDQLLENKLLVAE